MCLFYQDLQQDEVQRQVKQADHKITKQLYPALHFRVAENDVFRHEEPYRESDAEGNEQGGTVRLGRIEEQVQFFSFQDIFIADIVDNEPKQGVGPAGGGVAERLQVHEPPERRIEKINDGKKKIPRIMYMPSHCGQR